MGCVASVRGQRWAPGAAVGPWLITFPVVGGLLMHSHGHLSAFGLTVTAGTQPLPPPLSVLNSSHPQLSPWQVLVASLVV